jgi:erythromycin esterase-like protein
MRDFIVWLHNHNQNLPPNERVGIFGLDVYSLDTSMTAVTDYLEIKDPNLAQTIKKHYSCFDEDKFGGDPQKYGYLAAKSFDRVSCQRAVNDALNEIVNKSKHFANPQNNTHEKDLQFMNHMNARVVVDAEHYYRSMFDIREVFNYYLIL